jgi:hypothetical protein
MISRPRFADHIFQSYKLEKIADEKCKLKMKSSGLKRCKHK